MGFVLLGSKTRRRIVASALVTRHRQIPVIQQLSAVRTPRRANRPALVPGTASVTESLLEQYAVLTPLDCQPDCSVSQGIRTIFPAT
jgi:hypothetical protein